MMESEWLVCTDPDKMLLWLGARASIRKLTLFSVACCHRVWRWLVTTEGHRAVDVAERAAEGLASQDECRAISDWVDDVRADVFHDNNVSHYWALSAAWASIPEPVGNLLTAPISTAWFAAAAVAAGGLDWWSDPEWGAVVRTCYSRANGEEPDEAVLNEYRSACFDYFTPPQIVGHLPGWAAECEEQAGLLRDIFGNPFRPLPPLHPDWLAWSDGVIPKLATVIYDDRAFDRLPILADALEEAGCTDTEILSHCRGPRPHVRGCWVLDSLLAKQ
jgi:hypothetical protein